MKTHITKNTLGRKRARELQKRSLTKTRRRMNGLKVLPAHVTEEDDWRAEGTSVKTSRLFGVMLALHLVGVAGLAAFTIFGKDGEKDKAKAQAPAAKVSEVSRPAQTTGKPQPARTIPLDARAQPQPAPVVPENATLHRVRSGERWETIAEDYDVDVDELMAQNPDAGCIVGERLIIPRKPSVIVAQPVPGQLELDRAREEERHALDDLPQPVDRNYVRNNVPKEVPAPVVEAPVPPVKKQPKGDVRSATSTDKPELVGKYLTHTVSRGDTAFNIAKRYKISQSQLLKANGIADASKLPLGQKLRIPVQR